MTATTNAPGSPSTPQALSPTTLRLDANEPVADEFDLAGLLLAAGGTLHRYPVAGTQLTAELARRHRVGPEQVLLGGGSADLIASCWRTFASTGVAFGVPAFEFYPILCRQLEVPSTTWEVRTAADVVAPELLLAQGVPGLVVVCNPHNPTGLRLPRRSVAALADRLPAESVLLNDEAYAECVPEDPDDVTVAQLALRPNVVTTRTFSKMYGLPALRVGYAIAHPDLTARLAARRPPHAVNQLGALGALQALQDEVTLIRRRELTATVRGRLGEALRVRGFSTSDSCTNYLLVSRPDGVDWPARLAAARVLVKPVGTGFRVSVPAADDLSTLLTAVDAVLATG